jgi:tetratricopeptide (TPR) repeat protein
MSELRAFVGHSFTSEDEDVVGKFLAYFDQLEKLVPRFSWVHARVAEPKNLADKVMSLLPDRNLFIGICTRKERVVASTRRLFQWVLVDQAQIDWKTSDWTIQEIGLALGRGLQIILLIEEGVRKPGGLQGDIEYIPFSRTHPEESFGRIVEMITALLPKSAAVSGAPQDGRSSPGERDDDGKLTASEASDDYLSPKPDWTYEDYRFAVFDALLFDKEGEVSKLTGAFLSSEIAREADSRVSWEAYIGYTKLQLAKGGTLAELKALADASPSSSRVLEYLALAYEVKELFSDAASTYQIAANLAEDRLRKINLLGRAAACLARGESGESIRQISAQIKEQMAGEASELEALLSFIRLAELQKDKECVLALRERMLEISPDQTYDQFSLAYEYSELQDDKLSLLHYLRIPAPERTAIAWNNLGVQFQRLDLPIKAVTAYRQATEMNETLAMSNLAERFLSAGFLTEAEQQCSKALSIKDYHANVPRTLAKIKTLPTTERKSEEAAESSGRTKSNFYRILGRAILSGDASSIAQRWRAPDCVLEASLVDGEFRAVGTYEVAEGGLGTLGSLFDTGGLVKKTSTYRLSYVGALRGRAIIASVTRRRIGEQTTALGLLGIEPGTKALMILGEDGNELKVMENPHSDNVQFYSLRKSDA